MTETSTAALPRVRLDPAAVRRLLQAEQDRFARLHPASQASFEAGQAHYLYGAPSHWMRRWAGRFPLTVRQAQGVQVECIDGLHYTDFCLGDTGGMCGHAAPAVTQAVAAQLARGATLMLPGSDALWVGAELTQRFGLPYWGFTTSASDANRAAVRIARMVTGRQKVLVFNGCYHGSVEEAHVALQDGHVVMRNGIHDNAVDHARVSRVIEFNDPAALRQALADHDVACVLAEPFMTNYGLIEPDPGFMQLLRDETRRTGTLLVLDETHTFSSGPGGCSGAPGAVKGDFFVVGKAVGGGIPVGLYGTSQEVAERLWACVPKVDPTVVRQSAHLGFGGTLAGSVLQVAAVRAVLEQVLTPDAFDHMIALADRLAQGARQTMQRHRLPWHVAQVGARVETMFAPLAPRNAADVARGRDGTLEALFHVFFLNRGVLITPFHSMLLMCPATSDADVDRYLQVLQEFGDALHAGCLA